jgi:hypothetical protein
MPNNSAVAAATTTEATTLVAGQIVVISGDLIPVYHYSDFYVSGAKVVPDNVNWFEVRSSIDASQNCALHKSELVYQSRACKDESGNTVYCLKNYPFVRATDKESNYVYFINEAAAEAANFKFSFRFSGFHDASCSQFFGSEKVLSYHTSQDKAKDLLRLKPLHTEADEYLLGLEVEKVDSDLKDKGDAWELLHSTGWSKERDGSLGDSGYEFVSPILPLFNTDVVRDSIAQVGEWVDGGTSSSCGGHITLSKRGLSSADLLESFKSFAPIIYALYKGRLENTYCKAKLWSKYFQYPEKYSAFYIKDGGTKLGGRVEVRLPSRVVNQEQLLWRVELFQLFIKDGGNFNQLCQKIGCPESALYKHFAKQYSHEKIGEKLRLSDEFSKTYATHRNGLSPSVKKRINNTMSFDVFPS